MAKVVSSYSSVVRGVSEQVAQDRHPGQHFEQINMVSDPVRGTVRRHGSRLMAEKNIGAGTITDAVKTLLRTYREHSFFMNGTEYSLVYRSAPSTGATLPLAFCFNKDTKTWLNVVIDSDASMSAYKNQGLASITNVGKYLLAAGNNLIPAYTQVDNYAAHTNQGVAWVRAGAYSRTFKLSIRRKTDNAVFNASYTTMASSYPTLLNTSDIPSGASDYQKQVNDRVYAWQSASNKWIGDAFKDQQPENIAQKLADQFSAAGYTNLAVNGSTIVFDNISYIAGEDSGDGSLLRVVYNEIETPDRVSTVHFTDKLVKVRAKGQTDAYYLKAIPEVPGQYFGSVTWTEAPAVVITPTSAFMMGLLSADNGTLYLAATQARLAAISGLAAPPAYGATQAGDLAAQGNKPYFLDHPVSMLTVFQDRLMVVSNGVVFGSKTGDYFNWFRSSMLSLKPDDPVEGYALGSEDDIISRSVTYNKDLFMFGIRKQFAISGRTALTPQSMSIATAASERNASFCQPEVLGNILFYGRYQTARDQQGPSKFSGAVAQFQLGVFQDTPETSSASPQLDKYIRGRVTEMAVMGAPTTLFARTDGRDDGLYVFRFLDQPGTQAREFDSWSRWEWDYAAVGHVVGMVGYQSSLNVYTVKSDGINLWLGAEEFVMDSALSDTPYLDSQRTAAAYEADPGFIRWNSPGVVTANAAVALDGSSDRRLLGSVIPTATEYNKFKAQYTDFMSGAVVGVLYDSVVDITPPYVRDQNDRAIVNGNLTVTQYAVSLIDTAGLDAVRTSENMDTTVAKFNGRVLGRANNFIGRQPVTDTTIQVPCAKGNTRHRMKFVSRTWLPMGISAIEWTGQFFNNARRV
ncbi:putative tail tuber protein B [Ralstonia phage RSJ5]|uniref:Putative tail tuber protein B n=1 Tax=Ralstonia phage RSJ5 TaxID=1538364 RepID=A0A077KTF1_9CAUD|nr:putative tail tuber protein B [Ralstonia phage RSJ5]BAP34926.1 putative tail tuber protein B [Ralstonia phage RSJ5]